MGLPKHHAKYLYPSLRATCSVIIFCLLMLAMAGKTFGQNTADTGAVRNLLDKINKYNDTFAAEKLYLTFDKPYYAIGDTIWFKAYLLNAPDKKASAKSNKIYVELLNDSSDVKQRLVIPMAAGLGSGDFKLETNLHEGTYSIRAYTNWMQNFGNESFFYHRFQIGKPTERSWLISEQHQVSLSGQNKQAKLAIQIRNTKGVPIVNEPLTIRLLDGRKGIAKAEARTGVDGALQADLAFPAQANGRSLSLLLISKQQDRPIKIPFYERSADHTDLQFMPESGNLVAGMLNKVGFKAIGEDGVGVEAEGLILNGKNEEVATFKSLHRGMGSFALVPSAGETYTARLNLPDGKYQSYILPKVQALGISMRVDAVNNKDTLRIYLTGTPDKNDATYYLIAQGRGVTFLGTSFKLSNGYFNTKIPTNKFPTGILNLMVMDQLQKPVIARNVFIDHVADRINLNITPDRSVYATNDSVSLNILANSGLGAPMQGSFSVSVTDDLQVRDGMRDQHIGSYFLLTSELKGNIEDPAWYFGSGNAEAARALDNLMLTQGWTGFDAAKALSANIAQPTFWAESDNSVTGKLSNFFNRPAVGRQVTLMSNRKGVLVIDTLSDANGRFTFSDLPFSDTTLYTIKIHNTNGKQAAVGIDVREFKPAPIPPIDSIRMMPWNANTDPALLRYLRNTQTRVDAKASPVNAPGNMLREVNIKDRRLASLRAPNGDDIYFADMDVNDSEATQQGNISLLKFLLKKPGFRLGLSNGIERLKMKGFAIYNVVVDNIPVNRYYAGPQRHTDFLQEMLDNIPAASVKNLVIYHHPTPNGKDWVALVIVKTRMGNGPIMKPTPGTYVYRPLPVYMPRDFYRPRYMVKNNATPDLRSTIHWEPNLVTDEKGKANLSFYAADRPGTYTVTVEGTDMQGNFGYATKKISIVKADGGK